MSKRSVIIVSSIVSTIVSLIVTFLSYFGLTRYIGCHINNCTSAIENYSKLPIATTDNRVVISFSVKPDKIKKLKPFINSILDQTVKVNLIAMIILDDNSGNYDIPKYIKDVASVFPVGRDYGKGTKIIPMLLREKECGTIIIALDENRVYGQDFIYSLIEESKIHPESILIDKKKTFMLAKPEHFGCDVINREKKSFDHDWFIQKASSNKIVNYQENYNIIGF